jgi:hypothetical protein
MRSLWRRVNFIIAGMIPVLQILVRQNAKSARRPPLASRQIAAATNAPLPHPCRKLLVNAAP